MKNLLRNSVPGPGKGLGTALQVTLCPSHEQAVAGLGSGVQGSHSGFLLRLQEVAPPSIAASLSSSFPLNLLIWLHLAPRRRPVSPEPHTPHSDGQKKGESSRQQVGVGGEA